MSMNIRSRQHLPASLFGASAAKLDGRLERVRNTVVNRRQSKPPAGDGSGSGKPNHVLVLTIECITDIRSRELRAHRLPFAVVFIHPEHVIGGSHGEPVAIGKK